MIQHKKGAIELSIGTIVVIVLAMSMLILGLVLVRNIFTGATESVDVLNDKTISAISSLFGDERADVIVKLGSDQTAKIKAGTDSFGVAIAARTLDGSEADRNRLKYKLTLEEDSGRNCINSKILGVKRTEELFITPINIERSFDQIQGPNVFAIIQIKIPKGTPVCTQKVYVDVRDTLNNQQVGGNSFIVEVQKEGLF